MPTISNAQTRFYTAIEQAGGARMFNAVVEDANVASQLVDALIKSKEGRLQFLPLKNLRPESPQFPTDATNAQPVTNCLRFDPKFEPAIKEVFGKTLLCENLESATGYRRSHNLACVTMDGDKIAKKGSIKGGYYNVSNSKIKLNKAVRAEEEAIRSKAQEIHELTRKKAQLDQANTALLGEIYKLDGEIKSAHNSIKNDTSDQDREREEADGHRQQLKNQKAQLAKLEQDIQDMQHSVCVRFPMLCS
jgi:structural maintenance of chromosome 3 (chondroitin sulfate proteoglycan 6)